MVHENNVAAVHAATQGSGRHAATFAWRHILMCGHPAVAGCLPGDASQGRLQTTRTQRVQALDIVRCWQCDMAASGQDHATYKALLQAKDKAISPGTHRLPPELLSTLPRICATAP